MIDLIHGIFKQLQLCLVKEKLYFLTTKEKPYVNGQAFGNSSNCAWYKLKLHFFTTQEKPYVNVQAFQNSSNCAWYNQKLHFLTTQEKPYVKFFIISSRVKSGERDIW